jgi:hypothetical protein
MEAMVSQGFDPALVHETETIATIAFGRTFFERRGIQFPPSVIHARRDGRVETDVPLMSMPAYTRGRAIAVQLSKTMSPDDFQALCLYSAESNALLKAMHGQGDKFDPAGVTMFPSVVPERGVSDETMDAAVAVMNDLVARNRAAGGKKPWWRFW